MEGKVLDHIVAHRKAKEDELAKENERARIKAEEKSKLENKTKPVGSNSGPVTV